jgi:serine/threonine-protein phosphatase PGAM5
LPRTTLYLVRHGEQDLTGSPDGGEPDSGLSPLGREQAAKLGRRLAGTPFGALHHSPLRRATETATILAEHLPGLAPHPCELARDLTPVPSTYPDRYQAFFDAVPADERDPGATRLREAVDQLSVIGVENQTDLVVTHNFVIGWFVRHVLDAPDWRWLALNQANCGLTIVRWETGRPPALVSFNDVGHL